METNNKPIVVPTTESKLCATATFSWFLEEAEALGDGVSSEKVPATFKALVNGKEAFGELYDRIAAAQSSVDIAIWGFQPSMYFKRDGKSLCIGDLLIEKALKGVKVRILVWNMPFQLQTVKEANLGSRHDVFSSSVEGVKPEQRDYDYWWYSAIEGSLDEEIVNLNSAGHFWRTEDITKHSKLVEFTKSPLRTNLAFKTRKVAKQNNRYKDNTLPDGSYNVALKYARSHHQKTVLIDYDKPESAVGFVLEHNMLDNYWDDNDHSLKTTAPNLGKNSKTPLQDVSSIVTGQVLWDINHNFCQSWDRKNNDQWGADPVEVNLTEQRKGFVRADYKPNPNLVEDSRLLAAQIVRTYDQPDVEDIMKVYLQNIKQTSSYIYTENQYFRFPPLVREFLAHWERIKTGGRTEGPIHWFTVTNSLDAGIGDGTYTTNEMFKLLGKQDVMPNVAKSIRLSELELELRKRQINRIILANQHSHSQTAEGKQAASAERQRNEQDIKVLEAQIADIKAKRKQDEAKQKQAAAEPNDKPLIENLGADKEEGNLTKALGYEISDTPGIKAHICTLMPKDENGNYVHSYKKKGKDVPAEVYVHSKVTIMDDVFTIISSANLNTRSMQVDTELGIITECADTAQGLRKRLWDLHTNRNSAANPEDMHDYQVAEGAFDEWKDLMKENKKARRYSKSPSCALREFYRADPTVSRSD